MQLSDIATIIKSMSNLMPESSRFILVKKFVELIGKNLTNPTDGDKLRAWVNSGGPQQFYRDCDLKSGGPSVRPDIVVADSDLAEFINKWMNVEAIRRDGEEEFVPVTPDMHNIRYTMVEELKQLAEKQRAATIPESDVDLG